MRRGLFLALALMCCFGLARQASAQIGSDRYAAIVMDARTGQILFAANPDELRYPASLTKMMTLYLLFERMESGKIKPDTPLSVSAHAASQAPTKLGLRPGQTLMVEDAIKGLVTKSANDAAVVIAEYLGGSEEDFAAQMTRKARALGMSKTVYRNASGLPNDEQVTTARDQATLGLAIQERFPRYYRYFATHSFTYRGSVMRNHNRLLGNVEGVDGIKTGYTRASGFNLSASAVRDNRRIIGVVMGGPSPVARDQYMGKLLDASFARVNGTTATPVSATCPMPSPSRDRRRCTRKTPISGARMPTRAAATSARCMKSNSRMEVMARAPRGWGSRRRRRDGGARGRGAAARGRGAVRRRQRTRGRRRPVRRHG